MGVSKNRGIPKWMVKIMENPIKMDDLGQHPYGLMNIEWLNLLFWPKGSKLQPFTKAVEVLLKPFPLMSYPWCRRSCRGDCTGHIAKKHAFYNTIVIFCPSTRKKLH